ncbi:unnamed protein product [Mytilus coruscus]|uniref:Farnesoic acid O-methyl transferase domain-containing protein n=1 Tax=Mytilus coruscus TaxID=42192 RepID=A0A6J8AMA2_MYTCO|nr:unnamed protein product [Mytilus coruscus]
MVYLYCGHCFDEIWIKTLNSGDVDASLTPDVFNHYTSLSDYNIFPSQNQFRISVEACHDAFILLSAAKSLQSQDFYEICMGAKSNKKTVFRRKYNNNNILSLHTPDILSCTERTTVVVRWTQNGGITLLKESDVGTEIVMTWTDPSPLPINGVGIMTSWGANGIWTIEHSCKLASLI